MEKTAEEKWEEWDKGTILFGLHQKDVCVVTRNAYKQALKEAIEKECLSEKHKEDEQVNGFLQAIIQEKLNAYHKILDLIDRVEPKE